MATPDIEDRPSPSDLMAFAGQFRLPERGTFFRTIVPELARFDFEHPNDWKHYGPYWPALRAVYEKYTNYRYPWTDEAVDYLRRYDYQDDFLNCVAAYYYRDRHGDYLIAGETHAVIWNGENRLYQPGVGLLETRD